MMKMAMARQWWLWLLKPWFSFDCFRIRLGMVQFRLTRFSYGSNGLTQSDPVNSLDNSVKPESTRVNTDNSAANSVQFRHGSVRSWISFGSDVVRFGFG
ncbi:hypothetical protein HanPSC8_Chr05g0195631 [Helianthus annuus]|nr:hypothetical protein HanPSC8_Chr05g0195631 [Helianthus annuus]